MMYLSSDGKVFSDEEMCREHEKILNDKKPQWMESDRYKLLIDKYHSIRGLLHSVYSEMDEYADELGLEHEDFFSILLDSYVEKYGEDEEEYDDDDDDPCKTCDDTSCPDNPNFEEDEEDNFDDEVRLVDIKDLTEFVTDCIHEYFDC